MPLSLSLCAYCVAFNPPYAGSSPQQDVVWSLFRTGGLPTLQQFGKNPNYENLTIFGCPSYALVPLDTRSKLDNHAVRTIFVGYGEPHGYKGYWLYDPKSKRFLFSRRVIFDEDKLISNPHPHRGDEKIQDATTMSNTESNKEVIVSPTNSWRAPPTSLEIQQVTTDHIPINPLPLMSSPLEARPQVSHFNR